MWLRDWVISITVLHCEPPENIVLSMTIKGSTIWGVTLLGNEATYNRPTRVQFFSRPTMIKSKSNNEVLIWNNLH